MYNIATNIDMPRNLLAKAEILLIILLACIPLFGHFPYRVNIFLSWEGAYRMSRGQLPFRDFGTPLGGMYWVIPAVFFKIFGPKLITLIKAQVFINIVAGLAFRSILSSLAMDKGIRLASILLFCMSYSFFNFWPWYNHSVIVYELLALAFLLKYIMGNAASFGYVYTWSLLTLAALFVACSFLTKQDGGGMGFLICCVLLAVHCGLEKRWLPLVIFAGSFTLIIMLVVGVFGRYGFGYWFNHGQPPHNARVSVFDIADEFFGASQWIKFYLLLIVILLVARYRNARILLTDRKMVFLGLLTLAILGEAAIFQVTSYTPPDNNIFFHSFAFACIFSLLAPLLRIDFGRTRPIVMMTVGILLWWSGDYWKYMERIVERLSPQKKEVVSATGENIVNRKTFMIDRDTASVPMEKWVECGLPVFDKVYMPPSTAAGIHRLLDMDPVKRSHGDLRVLNMSELTPLAAVIPYRLERDPRLPLWYHLGVGMFNKQAVLFEDRIRDGYYDLVLFEYIPNLNNFYPFRVRDSLLTHYRLADKFDAPRRGEETRGDIEVYLRK